ncbi:hypothetical protein KC343_g1406 [Hortaea werneckii]|uniref:Uncharacterized protein n=1 Tax=Hortaea werneckii TaxID=91943 RepID=A0A3M7HMV4_HORWE|nr:hypothetical protein KC338_g1805 [Hortaea werneckii]KAI7281660.1 hypothetical protein KC352_g6362 [Hortaea werneckii]KAI7352758.1 hypothetical protein KC320_g4333 [Hortaea werneckii]KAI7572547.1 hypothetical protein KC317_g663 [Hortaea werneckii]KAI7627691.1 hypothetical protein KC346_g621 [Hortaea werneckii]
MHALTKLLASLAAAAQLVIADYGVQFSNALSTGPVAQNSFIREASTTLILPDVNSPQTGNLALWPGMGTSDGDLIQGLAISNTQGTSGCSAAGRGVWCIVASTLETTQKMGEAVAAEPGSSVTFNYKYNDQTSQYDQTVSLNGEVVSRLSTSSGRAQGWGTAIECQQSACGTVPSHQYVDTKASPISPVMCNFSAADDAQLIMDVADPSYIQTLGTTGATGDMVTDDNGKTWTIDTINIDSYTYE